MNWDDAMAKRSIETLLNLESERLEMGDEDVGYGGLLG
jgi:hypothetical protein